MGELAVLYDLVVIFAIAVAVVALLRRVGLPSIAGFILAGTLVGPSSLGLLRDPKQLTLLAEVGVVLLLFGVGLELSVERLRRSWRPVVLGGALQVTVTTLLVVIIGRRLGLSTGTAFLVGYMIATSSTAIVLRGLDSRGELESPHGRFTLGILVFQDLCVVPMVLSIPLLSGSTASPAALVLTLLKAIGITAVVLVAAGLLVPRVLRFVAQTRERDLFVLTVFLACVGTAWLASMAGVSLALGAFLAGLVVAGSEYRHQALADIIPFREVLTSVFFVSVGTLVDPRALWARAGTIVALVFAILIGKFLIVFLVGLLMRLPLRVCVVAAMALAQVGEFSFVLSHAAEGAGLVSDPLRTDLLTAVILTMLITPVLLMLGPRVGAAAAGTRLLRWLATPRLAEEAIEGPVRHDHVIIAGYGLAGRGLARSLGECGVPYVVADLNPENVRAAIENGVSAYFGDVTNQEVLDKLGVARARELVVVINDPAAADRAVSAARRLAPHLHILVRSRHLLDVESLLATGASRVIPAEVEGAVEVTAHVLRRHCVDPSAIERHLARVRECREETTLSVCGGRQTQREPSSREVR
ncbi:MAG: cation:proton antiporter [Acidobacteriota bacterium]